MGTNISGFQGKSKEFGNWLYSFGSEPQGHCGELEGKEVSQSLILSLKKRGNLLMPMLCLCLSKFSIK